MKGMRSRCQDGMRASCSRFFTVRRGRLGIGLHALAAAACANRDALRLELGDAQARAARRGAIVRTPPEVGSAISRSPCHVMTASLRRAVLRTEDGPHCHGASARSRRAPRRAARRLSPSTPAAAPPRDAALRATPSRDAIMKRRTFFARAAESVASATAMVPSPARRPASMRASSSSSAAASPK